jgi:hypothetical protein
VIFPSLEATNHPAELFAIASLKAVVDLLAKRHKIRGLPAFVLRRRARKPLGEVSLAIGVLVPGGVDRQIEVVDGLPLPLILDSDAGSLHLDVVASQGVNDPLLDLGGIRVGALVDVEDHGHVDVVVAVQRLDAGAHRVAALVARREGRRFLTLVAKVFAKVCAKFVEDMIPLLS